MLPIHLNEVIPLILSFIELHSYKLLSEVVHLQ